MMTPPVELHSDFVSLAGLKAETNNGPFQTIWETDCRGMNHYQSPSWYRYVGEGLGSSFGEDWLRFYHPEDREYLKSEWGKSLSSDGAHPYDIEVRIRRHDGEYRWFRVRGEPIRSGNGQVVKWAGTCTDIHGDKKTSAKDTRPVRDDGVSAASGIRAMFRFGPLERRLFFTVFFGLLPLALLSFATLVYNAHNQKRQLIQAADDTMRAVVTAVDSEIAQSFASLDALATSPRLARNDISGFYHEAKELLARRPGWANVILSDRTAQQVMNARLAPGSPLPLPIDPASVEEAVRTGKPGVGDIVFSPVLNMHAFAVRIPIKRGDEVVYVLGAIVRPNAIQEILKGQGAVEQGVVGVFDRNNNVVARSLSHDEWVSKPASPGLLRLLEQGRLDGWATTKTLEGTPVYSVFHRSTVTGWSAAIGIPTRIVDSPVIRSYQVLGGSILVSLCLGLFAASLIGRTITKPMRELERAAVALGKGEPPAVPDTKLPEIRRAALALTTAHFEREKLLQSEREARLLEKDARLLAENASKTKDEFLAMLGHELRNPLSAISMASQILDRVGVSAAAADQAKVIIQRQVRHLSHLTDDLLDAGRVMMGKINLDRKPIDLADTVRGAVETLRNTGQLSQHELTVSLNPVWVEADATRIDQIVDNLLTNAVKYTPSPGAISVAVERDGANAVFRVCDSGLGLDPDLTPRIFDLFVQGERSLDRSQGGLGIGLTLVRRLAELHGGRVEAKSEGPGKGSEFIVRLPAIEDLDKPPASSTSSPAGEPRTIVIVDDNPDALISLRYLLELDGHQVHEASDGPSGVETILRECPDIALIDIGLPVLDGYAVAQTIRSRSERRVRLIAVTGYGNREDVNRGMLAGFDEYLVKPVDPSILGKLILEV